MADTIKSYTGKISNRCSSEAQKNCKSYGSYKDA